MNTFRNLKFSIDRGIARLVMSRPPLNILNTAMLNEINRALDSLADTKEVKALVFSSDQKAFSAGMEMADHTEDKVFSLIDQFQTIFRTLEDLSIPTVAAVQGMALGAGCELAAFCDFVIATGNSVFGQPEIKIGVFPPLAAVYFPRLMGARLAAEVLLLGESIDSQKAQQYGLVSKVVSQESIDSEVEALLSKLSSMSGAVLRVATRAMRIGIAATFQDTLERVSSLYLDELMLLEDTGEGIQAFVERRKPEWKNR
ncbi:MAG: enoyl-CoA hydratase/isomerase family protein [Acidobacteria bacterium]|nr:enoyl-CoA hydratase/isomerase family protein [Acidobacteriota bacterium]